MVKNRLRNVFIIIASAFPFAILKNVILGRELNETDMGLMSLLITIISFVYPVALLGQHNALVRFLSKGNNTSFYNWKLFNLNILLLGSILSIISSLIFLLIYKLNLLALGFLTIGIIASLIGDLYKEVPRSIGRFEISLLLQRSERYIFPIILILLYLINSFNLTTIFISFGFLYIFYSLGIILYTYRTCPNGAAKFPSDVYRDGLFFWGSDLSLIALVSIDKFFIAKLCSIEDLAVYFSTFTITRLYDIVSQAVEYVLLPYSNKVKNINIKKIALYVGLVALFVTIFYLIAGPKIQEIVYKGKYNHGIELIPWFCIVGIVRSFYIIPSSIIGGRLGQAALKLFFYFNFGMLGLNIILGIIFTYQWQLFGAIIATLVVWSLRTIFGFIIMYRYKN